MLGIRHRNRHAHAVVALAGGAEPRHALAAQAELLARLRARRNLELDRPVERLDLDRGAERRLRKRQLELAPHVGALALEDLVLGDVQDDVEIAPPSAAPPLLALAGQAQARAGVDAGGDLDLERALDLDAALAAAFAAGVLHHPPGAAALRAGAGDGEKPCW
jgi:hypothetical protein